MRMGMRTHPGCGGKYFKLYPFSIGCPTVWRVCLKCLRGQQLYRRKGRPTKKRLR